MRSVAVANSLIQYSSSINEEHRLAFLCAREAVAHAKAAGELLLQAKREIKHGEWVQWIEDNCEVSPRVAQSYMRIAENWDVIEANSDATHGLTIDAALKAIPKPERAATPAPIAPKTITQPEPKTKTTSFLPPDDALAKIEAESKAKDEQLAEMAKQQEEMLEELTFLQKQEDAGDPLKEAHAEVKRLQAENRVLRERLIGLENEKHAATKAAKDATRKAERLEKMIKELRGK
jgi:hypothetical protein